jgi:hypothetical protein
VGKRRISHPPDRSRGRRRNVRAPLRATATKSKSSNHGRPSCGWKPNRQAVHCVAHGNEHDGKDDGVLAHRIFVADIGPWQAISAYGRGCPHRPSPLTMAPAMASPVNSISGNAGELKISHADKYGARQMSEPHPAFIKLRMTRPELVGWLNASPPRPRPARTYGMAHTT